MVLLKREEVNDQSFEVQNIASFAFVAPNKCKALQHEWSGSNRWKPRKCHSPNCRAGDGQTTEWLEALPADFRRFLIAKVLIGPMLCHRHDGFSGASKSATATSPNTVPALEQLRRSPARIELHTPWPRRRAGAIHAFASDLCRKDR